MGKATGLGAGQAEECHLRIRGEGGRCLSRACCLGFNVQPASCMLDPVQWMVVPCACATKLEQAGTCPPTPGDPSVASPWGCLLLGPPSEQDVTQPALSFVSPTHPSHILLCPPPLCSLNWGSCQVPCFSGCRLRLTILPPSSRVEARLAWRAEVGKYYPPPHHILAPCCV